MSRASGLIFAGITLLAGIASLTIRAEERARLPEATPVVADDGSVTFFLEAPNAKSAAIGGDMRWGGDPIPMKRLAPGTWTATIEGLAPDYYDYWFLVDGVRTVDPRNPWIKQGTSQVSNIFLVPGDEIEFAAIRDVPHGQIRQLWYHSTTLDRPRRMHVYTPPGYDETRRDYPVLYLIHGGGEEDSGWPTIGRAGFILDNLIATGDATPMVLVMPNGDLSFIAPNSVAFADPSSDAATAARYTRERKFVEELMNDIVPVAEKNFRIFDNPENRALAGLSMGGAYTMETFKQHPLQFSYYGVWSLGFFYLDSAGLEEQAPVLVANAERVNEFVKVVQVGAGDIDPALPGARRISRVFDAHGINHEFLVVEGSHTWLVWRVNLREFAPRLFH